MIPDLIFDVGMHKGEDTSYYLEKGYRVVSFEANTALVEECRTRFVEPIRDGRLTICHGAIADSSAGDRLKFYTSSVSVWGTIEQDWVERNDHLGAKQTDVLEVDRIDMAATLAQHGTPYYVKIDVEGVDRIVLESLYSRPDRPAYISIESEKVDFGKLEQEIRLLQDLGYREFCAVQQSDIPGSTTQSRRLDGTMIVHRFEKHSSGGFGSDLKDWKTADQVLQDYRRIFERYRYFGDTSRLGALPPKLRRIAEVAYKGATGYRGPLPGWFDTHARL